MITVYKPDESPAVRVIVDTKPSLTQLYHPSDSANIRVIEDENVPVFITQEQKSPIKILAQGVISTGSTSGTSNEGGSNSSNLLPHPDKVDDTQDDFYYMSWYMTIPEHWLIRRQRRSDSNTTEATISQNPMYMDLDEAWPNRLMLTYI